MDYDSVAKGNDHTFCAPRMMRLARREPRDQANTAGGRCAALTKIGHRLLSVDRLLFFGTELYYYY